MRISCKVDCVNIVVPNGRPAPCKAVLLLAKSRTDDTISLTLHTPRNAPKSYSLCNVTSVNHRLIEEGMMSITFTIPPHMLMISEADPKDLKMVITALKTPDKFLAYLKENPIARQAKELKVRPDVLSLRISDIKQYPSYTGTGFPSSLRSLIIASMLYRHVDTRILNLIHLVTLDLSDNHLKKIPAGLWDMKLVKLDLSRNSIPELPNITKGSAITKSLQHLELSDNKLTLFPPGVCYLQRLNTLNLNTNNIQVIPHAIKNIADTLRYLSMMNCKLRVLPAAMSSLSLDNIDISGNQFPHTNGETMYIVNPRFRQPVPSLQEFVVKCIIRHSISVPDDLPLPLSRYISSSQWCKNCSRMVLDASIMFLYPLTTMKTFASSFTRLPFPVTIQGYVCNKVCWREVIKGKRVIPACTFIKPIVYF